MLKPTVIAGVIGRPVDEAVLTIRRAYPRQMVVAYEREETLGLTRNRRRIRVHYDAATRCVYEVQSG